MRSTTLCLASLLAIPAVSFSTALNTDVTLRDMVTREVLPYAIVDVTMKSRFPNQAGTPLKNSEATRVVRYLTNVNGSFSYPASGDTLNEAISLKVFKSGYATRDLFTGFDGKLTTNDAGKSLTLSVPAGPYAKLAVAGVRSSNYGASKTADNEGSDNFPRPIAFKSVTKHMKNSIGATRPSVIWIVSEVAYETPDGENWYPTKNTLVQFEKPENSTVNYLNTTFSDKGAEYTGADGESHFYSHTDYLNYFEKNGIDVYLQIESGQADVVQQFDLVLDKFKGYSCVKGIGIDVEFYNYHVVDDNNTVDPADDVWENDLLTDAVAQKWYKAVKAKGERYSLFLKHFRPGDMPPTYRGAKNDIIYVDDTQDMGDISNFLSSENGDGHIIWANNFYPNPVWFQIGYPSDWDGSEDADPAKEPWFETAVGSKNSSNVLWGLSSALTGTAKRDQQLGIIWVDFTMKKLFPQSFTDHPATPAPAWNRAKTYQRSAVVMYGGATWEATYWSKGAVPAGSAAWKLVSNKDLIQDWIIGTPYKNGDRVMFNDQAWQARWWTQGDKPGTSEVWLPLDSEDTAAE